jgi:hypothetical protein
MRRIGGFVALSLGLVLLFFGPLTKWYVYPRVAKAPIDVYENTTASGFGKYFSAKTFQLVGPVPMLNLQTTKSITSQSSSGVGVYDFYSSTENLAADHQIDYSIERWVVDRTTGAPVHCCGEHPRHNGLTLKFPFNVQRGTYLYWDQNAHRAFPAKYSGEDTRGGLTVYVFKQTVRDYKLESTTLPGGLVGSTAQSVQVNMMYSADTFIYVEPFTGAIVDGSQHAVRWFADASTGQELLLAADTNFSFTRRYIDHIVSLVKPKLDQLRLLANALPWAGPVAGVVLIAVGFLLVRPRQRAPAVAPVAKEPATSAGSPE